MATRRQGAASPVAPPPPAPSPRVSGYTSTTVAPRDVVLNRFLLLLAATSVAGTVYSLYNHTETHTAFRSRLPASSLASSLGTSSLFPTTLPYFADKRNLVNQIFVKKGWFWTTLFYLAHSLALYVYPPTTSPDAIVVSSDRIPLLLGRLRSLSLATAYWYLLTQGTWFLTPGHSISHQVLLFTGAECVPSSLSSAEALVTGGNPAECTGARGEYYKGGHDVSGHTFLLVLSSLLLVDLVVPTFLARSKPPPAVRWTMYATLALIVLWWWMLVATSVYFHTPAEKFTGFVFALGGWLVSRL